MSEPDHCYQTAGPEHLAKPSEWAAQARSDAYERDCKWVRVSHNPKYGLLLLEAWKTKPEDMGEPRWALVKADDKR